MARSLAYLLLIGAVLFLLPGMLHAQGIVNVEKKRIVTDTTGWAGSAGVGFNLSKYTEKQVALYSDAHLQYKSLKYLYLLVGSVKWVEAGGEKFVNDGFLHFRVNRKFNSLIRWEAFTQLQYNKILKVQNRLLLGTGPRFKLSDTDHLKVYLAPLYMYEREELIEDPVRVEHNHRLSAYLSTTLLIGESTDLTSTIYYQPRLDDFGDYRISGQAELDIEISELFSFYTRFTYVYDSVPPLEVPDEVYTLSNGIKLSF